MGYGGHGSIPFANYAFTQMGERTGTFTTVVSRDPAVFDRQNLKQFDAVCLNNTVGNLFTDAGLRRNLLEFVLGGGGLLGIHGTTVAFTDFPQGAKETWPEFGRMIGGRGAPTWRRTNASPSSSTRPAIRSTGPSAAGGSSTRASSFASATPIRAIACTCS